MFHHNVNRIYIFLLLATAVTFGLGESGTAGREAWVPVLLMFGLAAAKAYAVISDFMEIHQAPALWKRLLYGWLILVVGGILLAYAFSLRG
jgi:cytochrome c oxidase subunit 4